MPDQPAVNKHNSCFDFDAQIVPTSNSNSKYELTQNTVCGMPSIIRSLTTSQIQFIGLGASLSWFKMKSYSLMSHDNEAFGPNYQKGVLKSMQWLIPYSMYAIIKTITYLLLDKF
jgi:hypothetical protein